MNAEIPAHRTRFEWDTAKAKANLKKHCVSFETAARVFADPFAVTTQDRIEDGEYRWQTVGLVDGVILLLVAHTHREGEKAVELSEAQIPRAKANGALMQTFYQKFAVRPAVGQRKEQWRSTI